MGAIRPRRYGISGLYRYLYAPFLKEDRGKQPDRWMDAASRKEKGDERMWLEDKEKGERRRKRMNILLKTVYGTDVEVAEREGGRAQNRRGQRENRNWEEENCKLGKGGEARGKRMTFVF